MKLQSSIATPV